MINHLLKIRYVKIIRVLSGIFFVSVVFAFTKDIYEGHNKIRETDVPNDMAFFNGNDRIASFYFGRQPECNRNYLIYLEWLRRVYSYDYPEVLNNALPDTQQLLSQINLNDGYQSYYNNQAFYYYPVLGVSWLQANEFCKWKTDRYNEFILAREGILKANAWQINEDCFNSEAYLEGQYEGIPKNLIVNNDTHDTTPVQYRHHILLPSFRLPTESEWNFAGLNSEGAIVNSKFMYGKNYFLNFFEKEMHQRKSDDNIYLPIGSVQKFKPVQPVLFNDSIDEWIFNNASADLNNNDLLFQYAESGQSVEFKTSKQLPDKDFRGQMPIQYLCDDSSGKPIRVINYMSIFLEEGDSVLKERKEYYNRILKQRNQVNKVVNENVSESNSGFRCALTLYYKPVK